MNLSCEEYHFEGLFASFFFAKTFPRAFFFSKPRQCFFSCCCCFSSILVSRIARRWIFSEEERQKKRQCLQRQAMYRSSVWNRKYDFRHAYCGAGDELPKKGKKKKAEGKKNAKKNDEKKGSKEKFFNFSATPTTKPNRYRRRYRCWCFGLLRRLGFTADERSKKRKVVDMHKRHNDSAVLSVEKSWSKDDDREGMFEEEAMQIDAPSLQWHNKKKRNWLARSGERRRHIGYTQLINFKKRVGPRKRERKKSFRFVIK